MAEDTERVEWNYFVIFSLQFLLLFFSPVPTNSWFSAFIFISMYADILPGDQYSLSKEVSSAQK